MKYLWSSMYSMNSFRTMRFWISFFFCVCEQYITHEYCENVAHFTIHFYVSIVYTHWRQSGLKSTSARMYITSGWGRENGVFMYIISGRGIKTGSAHALVCTLVNGASVHFERRLVKLITELFLKCIAACLMLCIWLNSGVRILQSIQQRFTWRLHNNFCQGIFKNPPLSVSFSCLLEKYCSLNLCVCVCLVST